MGRAKDLISAAMLSSTDALSMLFETSSECVMLITLDGRLARVNRAGLRGMEIADPDGVVGAEWASFWPEAQRDEVRGAIREASSGATAQFQGYCPTATGAPKWWDVTVAPLSEPGGGVVALLSVSRDVSEYAAGRQALVTLVDGGVITGWSPQAHAMFGWSADEAVGRTFDFLLPERQHAASRAWFARTIVTGEIGDLGRAVESTAVKRTGEEFPIECVMSVLPAPGGWMLLASIHDISTSRAETELFETAFRNAPIGEALVSLEGRFLKLNQAFCALVGFDEAVLLAKDFQGITHPDDLAADFANRDRLLAGDIPGYRLDKRYLRQDGSEVWVNLSVSLVRFADGRPRHFIAQVVDLTARRQAEGRYRLLADNVSDIVGLHDENGRCLYISPSAEQIFGYAPEEVIGQSALRFIPEHAQARFRALGERIAGLPRGETVTHQLPMLHKDGREIWVELAARVTEDDRGRPVTVMVTRDITDRLETERRYRLLAENTADMLVLADLTGKATFIAGACERVLGWTPDEVLAIRGPGIVHPEDYERVHETFLRVGKGERDLHSRYRSRAKDGSWRWLESHPSLVVEETGVVGVVDAVRDVTEQVAQEAELARAREEAEAAAMAKSQFLANMSHEIRTPLTSVIGFADLLLEREDLQSDVRRYADRIGSASRALLTIVNDVLDFSKLDAGQFEIHPAPAQPRDVVEEALAIFGSAAEAKGLQLRLVTEVAAGSTVEIDAARTRQVLLNLIGNAVKFTDKGEVVVRLSCADGRMAVAVEDTGAGIDPEDQRKLFQRFSQVDDSSTRRHGGTGLGLAICKGLVEAMGGTIELRSRPGEGSTFTFEISAPEVRAAPAQPEAGMVPHIDQLRILVADDNPVNRELVRAILEGLGANLTEASDGREALDVAASGRFDVILMDLRMPRLDGRGALDELRRSPGPNQDTPVLAFTADVLEPDLSAFSGRVAKPIEFGPFVAAIEACLREKVEAPATSAGSFAHRS